jgi:hypothetical protein
MAKPGAPASNESVPSAPRFLFCRTEVQLELRQPKHSPSSSETNRPFALLAPEQDECGVRYILFVEGLETDPDGDTLDQLLRRNPNYAYCRDLGRLLPPKLLSITNGFQTFGARQSQNGARLGDIKPKSFSSETGWTSYFQRVTV